MLNVRSLTLPSHVRIFRTETLHTECQFLQILMVLNEIQKNEPRVGLKSTNRAVHVYSGLKKQAEVKTRQAINGGQIYPKL